MRFSNFPDLCCYPSMLKKLMASGELRKLHRGWQGVDCQLCVIVFGLAISSMLHADVQAYLGWWPEGTSLFLEMGWNLGVVVAWHHNPKLHWDDLHASRCRRRESKGQRQGLQLLQNLFGVVVSDEWWWQVACGKWHVFLAKLQFPSLEDLKTCCFLPVDLHKIV